MSQETNLEEVTIESKTQDLEIQEPAIKTAEQIKEEEKDLKYKNFCINNSSRIEQWNIAHSNKNNQNIPTIPVYWDTSLSQWVWLNRASRRFR